MPGPVGKHPSVRARRNKTAGFRTLSAVPKAKRPPWPLGPDASVEARREFLRDQIAGLKQELLYEEDRRKRYRIKGQLAKAQLALGVLEIQAEQAKDAEAAIWAEVWAAPQATIWAENPATTRELALWCRWMVRAEQGDLKAAGEARQLSTLLGINPAALLKLRAEIENVEAIEDRGERRRAARTSPPPPENAPPGDGDDPRAILRAVK